MTKTGLYALAFLIFAAGTLLLVTAGRLRSDRAANRVEVLKVVLDESWKDQKLLKDYKLAERSGRLFDSHELDGKVCVVSFFFSACPTACLHQNRQVQLLHEDFAGEGVKFVSITCDPDRDTPGVLAEYARQFRAGADSWFFLTGELLHLRRVAGEIYQMPLDKETHSEKLIAVDRWGKIRGSYYWKDAEQMAAMRLELRRLLAETQPPPPPPPPPPPQSPPDDDE
jgi:cytochrome oxidase Cu insertion factor (SCO1/SenC/PrrC family)